MIRKITCVVLILVLLAPVFATARGTETETVPETTEVREPVAIYTPEDLLAIAEDPYGSYILMADLDLSGIDWTALDFYGSFDGNGHAILNLNITAPGEAMPDAYDGNLRPYACCYFGLFGTMIDAEVKNLNLINVRSLVEWEGPVFMGAVAGYAKNCTITDCTVTGCLELRAHDRCFGLAGMVGYGMGRMENCNVDVTLICVDTDPTTRDEQFLGGMTAISFFHIFDCQVKLDAYVSEHGYVHSGGIMGMHTQFPWTEGKAGDIINTHISGKVTFFEDNRDRRAYCEALVGEPLPGAINKKGSTSDFLRDERFVYDQELRPDMCEQPVYTEVITEPDCENFGYTTYTCTECGYTYTDHYTLRQHEVLQWTVTKEPTTEEEGESTGYCACGMEHTKPEPKLEPVETTQAQTEPEPETEPQMTETAPMTEQTGTVLDREFYILCAVAAALLLCMILLIRALFKRR